MKLESSSSFISTNQTSRGPRGNRMQQLAALWLADCTSGLMHLLTRKLIFHRGYILSHSLSLFPTSLFALSLFLAFSFHGSFSIDCSTRPFCSRPSHLLSFPHLWPWIQATPFTPPTRIYRYLQFTFSCALLDRSKDRSIISIGISLLISFASISWKLNPRCEFH